MRERYIGRKPRSTMRYLTQLGLARMEARRRGFGGHQLLKPPRKEVYGQVQRCKG